MSSYSSKRPFRVLSFLSRARFALVYALSIALVLALWAFVSTRYFNPAFFPAPFQVGKAFIEMAASGELWAHIRESLRRISLGFVIGSLLAVPLGLGVGANRYFRAFFEPMIEFFRFVPAIAWLTPVVLWFGIGETSKILIIVYTTIFIVAINTAVGVDNIPENRLRAGRSLGASKPQLFMFVIVPATMPFILTGMRLAMGNSFATVVAAEMVASDTGLGFLIFNSRLWMATDKIFVGIICLGLLGIVTDRLFRVLINRFAQPFATIE